MKTFLPVIVVALTIAVHSSAQSPDAAALKKQAKQVLATIEGEISLHTLKEPVEVLRDRWGIAHVYAKNVDDLFFAQGFVAAQDRLFQIDLWRRVAVGETSEIFGKEGLEGDRFARLMKYRGDMDAEWKSYSPDTKKIVTAFTRGINAYIDHVGDRLPIEFQLLGYRPKKWKPEDVLGRMSGIIMTRNFRREIFRAQLIAEKGLQKARQLAPTNPLTEFAPIPELDLKGINVDVLSGYYAATKALRFPPMRSESNNWAIHGSRTVSGKPLLASDPHRSIALPSLRYLIHLNAPGWNVIGSGEPALPGVAIGHNERIAWGFTIVCTDQVDVMVETINPENPEEYRVGESWKKIKVIREQVNVKGEKKPVAMKLRYTHNGPIIHEDKVRHRVFVLKWVGSEPGTAAYLASLAVDRARNWKEYLRAMEAWKLPCENMVYADVEGNIGWVAAALTPVRKNHNGLFPVPANEKYGWERFLKVDELPQELNPERGWIATANHNILPKDYKHLIALDWAAGYRFQQVKARLEAKKKFTLEDCKSMQHDVTSHPGRALIALAREVTMNDPKLEKLADVVRKWDGVLSGEAKAGPLHAAWLIELQKEFYRDRLPKALLKHARYLGGVKVALDALSRPTEAWFGKNPKTGRDELLRATFARAVKRVEAQLGNDPSKWRWDRLHTVTFHHPLETRGPEYRKAFSLGPHGRPGDALTPNNTRHNEKFEQLHGPTYRHVLDLSDWDKGMATSSPGQSGQLGSPHYDDLLPLWLTGKYFPLAFSRKKVEEVTKHRLRLMPKKSAFLQDSLKKRPQPWQRRSQPILSARITKESWCKVVLYSPHVIHHEGKFRMWYLGTSTASRGADMAMGYAESEDGIDWKEHPKNPILTGKDVPWGRMLQTPFVMFDNEMSLFRMWFVSGEGVKRDDKGKILTNDQQLGYATSKDGIAWKVHPKPLYPSGRCPCVIKEGPRSYRMWMGSRPNVKDRASSSLYENVYEFRSTDGLKWTRSEKPVLRPTGKARSVVYPFVVRHDGLFYLWHGCHVPGGHFELFCATSKDGTNWNVDHARPAFAARREKGIFDSRYTSTPCVVRMPDRWLLYYSARDEKSTYVDDKGRTRRDGAGIYAHVGVAVIPIKEETP